LRISDALKRSMGGKLRLIIIASAIGAWYLGVTYLNLLYSQHIQEPSRQRDVFIDASFTTPAKPPPFLQNNAAPPSALVATKGFFLLGMHRSGTSVLAGLLNLKGYSTGTGKLIGATIFNPKGYFELESIVLQNQVWLLRQNVSWHKGTGHFQAHKAKLNNVTGRDALQSLVNSSDPWMIKDPRLCLTVPAWIPKFKTPPAVVFTYRHPLSVSLSLCQRSATELFFGLRSWLFHNMHAIKNMRDLCVVQTSHHDIMENPSSEALRITQELTTRCGLPLPVSRPDLEEKINNFVSASLHHNKKGLQEEADSETIREMFRDCSFKRIQKTKQMDEESKMEMYKIALQVYSDLENGSAFEESYNWPRKMPKMPNKIISNRMKIWKPKHNASAW
jgi:hypothetical protein